MSALVHIGNAFDCNILPTGAATDSLRTGIQPDDRIPLLHLRSPAERPPCICLRVLSIGPRAIVIGSSLTFIGSMAPAPSAAQKLVFIDAEEATWDMGPIPGGGT